MKTIVGLFFLTGAAWAQVPPPVISSINPPARAAGSSGFTLAVNGSGFCQGATVNFNNQAVTTAFGSATLLSATIGAQLIQTAGSVPVRVITPPPGTTGSGCAPNATSNTVSFVIATPLQVTTQSLADATQNQSYTAQLQASGGVSPYMWSVAGGGLPQGITLNSATGAISGATAQTGTFGFTAVVSDGSGQTGFASLTLRVVAPAPPLQITTPSLPDATANVAYSFMLTAVGGTPPYLWRGDSLPLGLSINSSNGILNGTLSQTGTYALSVVVSDSAGKQTTKTFSLNVAVTPTPLQISPQLIPSGSVGVFYSQTFTATGGSPQYTWSLGSALPTGLSLNPGTGVLSGTPTQAGTTTLVIRVTDAQNRTASQSYQLIIAGPQAFQIDQTSIPTGTAGSFYGLQFTATGGIGTLTWSTPSALPFGLTLSSSGVLSGTPNQAGSSTLVVIVTDSQSRIATQTYQLVIISTNQLAILTSALADAVTGVQYTQAVQASGGVIPYFWTALSGLPPGISLGVTTGILSGVPTQQGFFSPVIQVTDNLGQTAQRTLSLNVNVPGSTLQIVTSTLPDAQPGAFYTQQLVASGGSPGYTWTLGQPALEGLPPGLGLSANGVIVGTPVLGGIYRFTVTVVDILQHTASKTFQITVGSGLTVTTSTLPMGGVGSNYSIQLMAAGGALPYFWAFVGAPPPGLGLDGSTGIVSGTPSMTGTFNFIVQVTDAALRTAVKSLQLVVVEQTTLLITTESLANGTAGVSYQHTFTAIGGRQPYVWTLNGSSVPGLNLNSNTGVLSGTPTLQGSFNLTVRVSDLLGATSVRSYSLNIGAQFAITTTVLQAGMAGQFYSQTLTVAGGTPPYFWTLTGSALPGLVLDASGILTGVPTQAGTYMPVFVVTDVTGQQTSKMLTLVIGGPLSIGPASIGQATFGSAYTQTFTATGGTAPYAWSAGGLPNGLSINASTGVLIGTPAQAGSFSITIRVTDAAGQLVSRGYTLTVQSTLRITTTSLPAGFVGTDYSAMLAASGGTAPFTWSVTSGALPDGVTLTAGTGVIGGTPTRAGTFGVTFQVTDSGNQRATQALTIAIISRLTILTDATLSGGVIGQPYNQALAASGGDTPYTWSVTGGILPGGMQLSVTGSISGTPSVAGRFTFTAQVMDGGAQTATREFTIAIQPPLLLITTTTLPNGLVGTAYSQTLAASGGQPPYTWSVSDGQLPSGVELSESGQLSGTPAANRTFNFTLRVTDSAGVTASRTFSILIDIPAVSSVTVSGLPATATPAQQSTPALQLGAAYPLPITVTFSVVFAPEAGTADDPMVQFASGGRTATFTIPAGTTQAVNAPGLQIGTVAGTITVTARLQSGGTDITPLPAPSQMTRVARAAPVISRLQVARTATGFDVTITGFSTAREVTTAAFRFTAATGTNVQTTDFTVQVGSQFGSYYGGAQSAPFGSMFTLTIPFAVTGNLSGINAVSVTLTNSLGSSAAMNATF